MPDFKEQLDLDLIKVFLNQAEFAEQAQLEPLAEADLEYNIAVIFDETYNESDPQGEGFARVQSKFIRVMVREKDVKYGGIKKGDRLTVRMLDYHIVTAETNGVGLLVLTLHKV